jgi:hypothetical protein
VPRVFDTPESAKKYIREQMPAWSGAKVRVKNACGTASNATDADVARYLSAAKDRIRGEVATLKDVVGLLKMKPMPPSAEKAHEKIVKAMASLQRALAELS